MTYIVDFKHCTGCLACVDGCPVQALDVQMSEDGFFYPVCDDSLCCDCQKCEWVCPIRDVRGWCSMSSMNKAYAVWSKRDAVRLKSASGGVFAELACHVIKSGGIAVGAVLDGTRVYHRVIDCLEDVSKLQGSKYLQSNTKGIYNLTVKYLRRGKTVLFSGTPCQVAGLLKIVDGMSCRDKLYTCDLVCHGVPSREFFDQYLRQRKKKVVRVLSFRDKNTSWKDSFAMTLEFDDGGVQRVKYPDDEFLSYFLLDLGLRLSCYDCPFATLRRASDLTLGDFWGNKSFSHEEQKGISLVISHSEKGEKLLFQASDLEVRPAKWNEVVTLNPRVYTGKNLMGKTPMRYFFSKALRYLPYNVLLKIYANTAKRYQFLWWPYKAILIFYRSLNERLLSREQRAALTEISRS